MDDVDESAAMISPSAQKRRICFASDPVSGTADAAARLMRSPTPYPKELRVLARYARYIQANGQSEYVHVEGLQNGEVDTNGVEIKEARVTANTPMTAPADEHLQTRQPSQYIDEAHEDIEARCYDELSRYADQQTLQSQPLMAPLHNRSHIHATLSPLLGDDEMDARAAFFYATAEQKITTPVPQIMDYENVSLCSSSVNPSTLVRFPSVQGQHQMHHNTGSTTQDRPSNEQASLFGNGSLSSAMGLNGINVERQYFSNGTGTRSPAMLPNPNQYYPYMEEHVHGVSQVESIYGTHLSNNQSTVHNSNNGPIEDVYYAASQVSDYSQAHWNNPALSQNGDRLSMTSDYARSEMSSVNNVPISNRQPPPYHIARAFTKKSKTDLQHYEHYRHQNGTIVGSPPDNNDSEDTIQMTNGHNDDNHTETDQSQVQLYQKGQSAAHLEQTEFHENFVNITHDSAHHQPQRITSPRIVDVQQQHDTRNGSASPTTIRSPNGMDTNLNPDSDSPASSVQSQSTTNSTQQRNGKSPWLFGYHKNPKVMQLSVPKTLEIGFTLTQPAGGGSVGIFVGDVDVNSIVNTILKRHDKVLDMDGVDFTRIALPDALTVLSNAGPIINMMISRI